MNTTNILSEQIIETIKLKYDLTHSESKNLLLLYIVKSDEIINTAHSLLLEKEFEKIKTLCNWLMECAHSIGDTLTHSTIYSTLKALMDRDSLKIFTLLNLIKVNLRELNLLSNGDQEIKL